MTASRTDRWLILLVVSSAMFLIVIDMTVLHTALPTLTRDLGASASEKLWIINAYALVVAGLLPGTGAFGGSFRTLQHMLLAGLAVFGMASLVAAFSPSPQLLIAGRALLAVGAAMMMPATLSIIRLTFSDDRERALAIGLWSAVASGGAAVGPLIGGLLLEYFWWGSVFLINVPIVVAALIAGLVLIPRQQEQQRGGLGPAEFADNPRRPCRPRLRDQGGGHGGAFLSERGDGGRDRHVGARLVHSATAPQRRSTTPLIDLTLFDNRDFRLAVLVALVSAFSIVGLGLVLSQRLQLVLGYSPLHAALFLLPSSLMAMIGGPLAGWLAPRCGIGYVTAGALLMGGLGEAGLLIASNGGPVPQILCLSLFGLGVGASIAAASLAIMSHAPAERAGMAA